MSETTFISFYLRYDTVRVFCKALRAMGYPAYVRFLVNTETMQMVLQPHDKKGFISFRVSESAYKGTPQTHNGLRIRSRAFCQLLAAKMDWDMTKSYRIPGKVYAAQHIVRFALAEAKEIDSMATEN